VSLSSTTSQRFSLPAALPIYREFGECALTGARMAYNSRSAFFQSASRPAIEGWARRQSKGQPRTRDWGPQAQADLDWGIRAHSRSFVVSKSISIRGRVRPLIWRFLCPMRSLWLFF